MKLFTRLSILIAVATIQACATSPEGRMQLHLVSSKQMDALGVQSFEQLKADTPVSKDQSMTRYVRCIADNIIPQLKQDNDPKDWEVILFADKQANAFALPGNKIGVYEGLLEYAVNQHQVAAVMGHEVGHVLAEHSNERVSNQLAAQTGMSIAAIVLGTQSDNDTLLLAGLGLGLQYGVILPFSRSHESEADLIGLDLMAKAGFDPRESIPLWQNMSASGKAAPEFLSTHPSSSTRIKDLSARMPKANQLYQQARARGLIPNCSL